MHRIVFIEPKSIDEHIFTQFKLPRLGTLILGTMMKEKGWDVEIIAEDMSPIILDDIADADIVGISIITNTADKGYKLADMLHANGITTVIGGPHATFMPEEALQHADFVIKSEGENAFMQFIEAWEHNRPYSEVPNLSYKKDGAVIHNQITACRTDLDSLPVIDFSLLRNHESMTIIPVQTSRGCPYDCSFCSVTGMFGRKFRYRSTEHIMKELRTYRDLGKMIFFYDDHFAANPRRAKELLRAMIQENLFFKWSTQVRVEVARDQELLDLMKKAGCHTLFIGFESVNPESLVEMNKKQTTADIVDAVKNIHSRGINIHGMFVYGFDKDTPATLKKTIEFAKILDITSAQFLLLTPFPGTTLRKNMGHRIMTNEWALYDTHHVVFHPARLTARELQSAQIMGHRGFYSLTRMIKLLFQKKWLALGIALYARYINFIYITKNRAYLRSLRNTDKQYSTNKIHVSSDENVLIQDEEKVAR